MDVSGWHWKKQSQTLVSLSCEAGKSVNEIAQSLPAGVYTTIRMYPGGKALCLQSHISRLDESARLCLKPFRLSETELRNILRVANKPQPDSNEIKIRIHVDLTKAPGDLYVFSEPLIRPTREEQAHGAQVLTQSMHRENPRAKATVFITTAEAIRKQIPLGINEILMVGEGGEILEGLSSNFFAIRNQMVWTAGEGVLMGITRDLVLQAISSLGIPLELQAFSIDHRDELQEAFITSTSRGVLPIMTIDQANVGQKCPGDISIKIQGEFERLVKEKLEPI
jgi:branched-chain amino acid aminotransferase